METLLPLLITALLAVPVLRLLLLPIRLGGKLLIHSAGGLICLGLVNSLAGFSGICIPVNAVTVLTAGIGGLPGLGLLALLAACPG